MRNIQRQAEIGEKTISQRRDIRSQEFQELKNLALSSSEGLYKALTTAFYFGFYQGSEQSHAEKNILK